MSRYIYEFQEADAIRFAHYVGISAKQTGKELRFKLCPYCKGGKSADHATFSINLNTGQFECKRSSCGARGNMNTLIKDFNFYPNKDVEAYIKKDTGALQYKRFKNKPKPEPKPFAVEYMESRGISRAITERYGITTRKDRENTLVFSFYDDEGTLQFIKYRNTDPEAIKEYGKEYCEKNCRPILFGMECCNLENKTLIFTEGQIDSLSLAEAGIENAVSVPLGKNGMTWVPFCWDWLQNFDTFIFFSDKEGDSLTLLDDLKNRLNGKILHVRLSDYRDCKDANEILQKYGKQALRDAVNNAIPISNPLIKSLADIRRKDLKDIERFYTGIQELDTSIKGMFMGQLIVVTGKRGQGKSTFTQQLGIKAMKSGFPVFFYSGELQAYQFKSWIERQIAGADYINDLTTEFGGTDYMLDVNIIPTITQWYASKCYVYDQEALTGEEMESLVDTAEDAIKNYGCRVIVLDNLMTAMMDDESIDLYRQQTRFVNRLTALAKTFNVCVILVAHPKKNSTGDADIISGSGNIANLADVVLEYCRMKPDNENCDCVVKILKNRTTGFENHEGIPLWFEQKSKRITGIRSVFSLGLPWEKDGFRPEPASEEVEDTEYDIPY